MYTVPRPERFCAFQTFLKIHLKLWRFYWRCKR